MNFLTFLGLSHAQFKLHEHVYLGSVRVLLWLPGKEKGMTVLVIFFIIMK